MKKNIFDHYINLMNFISKTIGPDYEITLLDATNSSKKIIAIVNGHISGRDVGAGLSPLAKKAIKEKEYENADYIINRTSYAVSGKALRSSMFFIKDDKGELEGILCINFDDSRFAELSSNIFSLCHPDKYYAGNTEINVSIKDNEKSYGVEREEMGTLKDTIENIIDRDLEKYSVSVDRLTQEERLAIIKRLDDKGIFMMKGAVNSVSEKLKCSQASTYRYLSMIRQQG